MDALKHAVSAEHIEVVRRPEGKRLRHVRHGYDTLASGLEWREGGGGDRSTIVTIFFSMLTLYQVYSTWYVKIV